MPPRERCAAHEFASALAFGLAYRQTDGQTTNLEVHGCLLGVLLGVSEQREAWEVVHGFVGLAHQILVRRKVKAIATTSASTHAHATATANTNATGTSAAGCRTKNLFLRSPVRRQSTQRRKWNTGQRVSDWLLVHDVWHANENAAIHSNAFHCCA